MKDGSRPLVDLWERAGVCWSTVIDPEIDSTSLIVCHGALGKAMIARAMGEEIEAFRDSTFALGNAECVELRFEDGVCQVWRRRSPKGEDWRQRASKLRGGGQLSRRSFVSCPACVAATAASLPATSSAAVVSGSAEPIKTIARSVAAALNADNVQDSLVALNSGCPSEEARFKAIFDGFSTPLSYKQKFLDKNAFLVYYTHGFDGPNRPNIEDLNDSELRQTQQFGLRNEAFIAIDEARAELKFLKRDGQTMFSKDARDSLERASKAVDSYLSL